MTLAASNGTLAAHLHVEGFESFKRDAFDRRKVRAAIRKAGRLVEHRARMNLALAGGAGNYPHKRTGVLRDSIQTKVSRPGFLVRIMPQRIAGMKDYYPAYLHYGTKGSGRGRKATIAPRGNYIADALEDEADRVRQVLSAGFAAALK